MADFWIKVEKGTPDKPEVFEIAEILQIDPDAVLGKLIRVWCWLDSNSENGHIKTVTHVLIDRLTSHKGFAESMVQVGWLTSDGVPNFARHLGESAKKRAKDSERKRKSRETSEECHTKPVTESGLDKSRVDKDIHTGQQVDLEDVINENKNKIPVCQHEKIIEIYHEVLPELPRTIVHLWGGARKKNLNARWKEYPKHQDLEFWRFYFGLVRKSSFHMGENDRGWQADLEWLVNQANFAKILGKYA